MIIKAIVEQGNGLLTGGPQIMFTEKWPQILLSTDRSGQHCHCLMTVKEKMYLLWIEGLKLYCLLMGISPPPPPPPHTHMHTHTHTHTHTYTHTSPPLSWNWIICGNR